MSVRSFRPVFMAGGVAAAALSCYLVSLRVASERAALEAVETEIVLAQRDIRLLQTEIGTRGRLAQLERWNVKVLALSAPSADQFVADGYQLASLVAPEKKPVVEAPVVYASAPAETPATALPAAPPPPRREAPVLLHEASLKTAPPPSVTAKPPAKPSVVPPRAKPVAAPAAKPAVKLAKVAKADPLAPLAGKKKPAAASTKPPATPTARDSDQAR